MAKKDKSKQKVRTKVPGSLLAPEAMGGIIAGKGFDFQTRYAACSVPLWLLEAAFRQLFFEGTGDIDIRFDETDQSSRVHLQIKDHEVKPAELKEVIETFKRLEASLPNVYKYFTLVCPSLSSTLRPVENGLTRFHGAKSFYEDNAEALAPTKSELEKRLSAAGFHDDIDFILTKVKFDIGHGDMHHDDRAVNHFISRLLNHPDYAEEVRATVLPAFAEVLREIGARKGKVIERAEIESLLQAAVASGASAEKKITLWLQNWTKETFDPPADYALDWSAHFDRATRRVPSPEMWNSELLPELTVLRATILAEKKERLIRFRGKCSLSTGIALGAAFPIVAGWHFEIPQPPAKDVWRSDATPPESYDLSVEIVEGIAAGTDIVVGFNIKGDGRQDIQKYIESTDNLPRLYVFLSPSAQGVWAIAGPGEAVAFAAAARDQLSLLLKTHGLRKTRIFFYGPFALAVFFGQQLSSIGEVQLFEYKDPGYAPSCSIRT